MQKIANLIRQDIIRMLCQAGSGHPGGSLSIVEILVALYFGGVLEKQDKFILSKAHCCPALYAVFAELGLIPKEELLTLRKLGSRLQGHPDRLKLPILETSGGSLGQGLSIGIGMALADKSRRVYVLMSDGEQQEGQTLEAMMFASQHKIDNLIGIIDINGLQIDGNTTEIMGACGLEERYRAFNWHIEDIDGHNIQSIINACEEIKNIHSQPSVILCHTIKGKGVSFMENKLEWHGKAPSQEEARKALHELKKS
ncbi:MAG: transketolase [bacterium]